MHIILKSSNGKSIIYELNKNDNIETIKKKFMKMKIFIQIIKKY